SNTNLSNNNFKKAFNPNNNEDPKITLEDSWNDSSKEEHEESYPVATGTLKVHLNISYSNKALSIDNLENDNCELIEINEDFIKRIEALLKEKRLLQEETNKLTNKANELDAKIKKDIKVKEVIEP
ncbi:hypothetical protein Tco_1171247, partial [Tanacetum coccineum]